MDDSIKKSLEQFGIELPQVPNTTFGQAINHQSVEGISISEKRLLDTINSMFNDSIVVNETDESENLDPTISTVSDMYK